jgi:formylglycine-generating enzyme required for sulfatase activity
VDTFYIDEHEVTNVRYRKFLDWVEAHGDEPYRHPQQPAGKSHRPRYWSDFRPGILQEIGIARLQPFDAGTFQGDQQPVVGIDWFDAHAYARWAGKRLLREEEWEKASRGTDGRLWPWGNQWDFSRCNSGGYEWNGERDGHVYPAPVGSYPTGISPYGCLDMAGNVGEWTASDDVPGPVNRPGDLGQVVKGGGSSSYPSAVTAASREVRERTFRYFCLGFRCARNGGR